MITVYIILGLFLLCAVCIFIISIQAKSVKKYKSENAELNASMQDAAARLESIREYIKKNNIVEETANAQRQELNNTADAGLVSRANNLFGVRNKPDGGNDAA